MILKRFLCLFCLIGLLTGCASPSHEPAPLPPTHQPENHANHVPCTPPEGQAVLKKTPYVIDLQTISPLAQNQPTQFKLKVLNQNGQAVAHNQFRVMHGRRVHALIIDPSLTDYQHIHLLPETENGKAIYDLPLTPTQVGQYKIYLDVVDQSNQHYFLATQFSVPGKAQAATFDKNLAKGTMQSVAESAGLSFVTEVDTPIHSGQHVMLGITVKKGDELFRKLEPVMQAYAHLVGFNADRTELIHAHPMGEEPRSSNQRGGPNLMFGLEFPEPGNYRLFLQVRVGEKDVFVPIDVNVV